jgi:hypothetical protein
MFSFATTLKIRSAALFISTSLTLSEALLYGSLDLWLCGCAFYIILNSFIFQKHFAAIRRIDLGHICSISNHKKGGLKL